MPWLFLLAYACSGFAGLVYEVSWTRLLTLTIGHTTGAASTVVGAFLGGLAAGAWAGGRYASGRRRQLSLRAYVACELGVAALAARLPGLLEACTPLLAWAYADGAAGVRFPLVRLAVCFVLVFVPAGALGATFPLAIRWLASETARPARWSGALYAVNTVGASAGALAAGFLLIPGVGLTGTTVVGIVATGVAASAAGLLMSRPDRAGTRLESVETASTRREPDTRRLARSNVREAEDTAAMRHRHWLPALVLGLSGFAALVHEIAWTRILALVLGPTIYAFSAALAAVIAGLAIGSAAGTWLVGRSRHVGAWLAMTLAGGAVLLTAASLLAGGALARLVARGMASSTPAFEQLLLQGLMITAALMMPTAACLGAAFPLGLAIAADPAEPTPRRFGMVYAVNTIGAVSSSLASGFLLIPRLGLQGTLTLASLCLVGAALVVLIAAAPARRARAAGGLATAAASAMLIAAPRWDRALLASGAYLYAPYVPAGVDTEALLKAGTLLYYREGAAATVSVKRLTGTKTLAVDGKTDASNRGDMLTQKLVAHLPLLLHEAPRDVAIVGLGSGVTAGAALAHPIARADVVEISPEVVEASRYYIEENHRALDDPRTRLIVGDGRSHLLLSRRQYDVIVSEPSNPWIAGVAALFTHEFFEAARARLEPGGIICQWANAYNISDRDLAAIVATFRATFPDATAWLVGTDDVLLVGSRAGEAGRGRSLEERLANIERGWSRPGVAADLAEVGAMEPFAVWSLYAGGPAELGRYAAGAALLTDDRLSLEFSTPREIHRRPRGDALSPLAALLSGGGGPPVIRGARASAGAADWRNRGAMMARRDAHAEAYADFVRALTLDAGDGAALDGLVRTAILTRRASDALAWLKALTGDRPPALEMMIATSRLLAAAGAPRDAIEAARQAVRLDPESVMALEQLASVHADAGDARQLEGTVEAMRKVAPDATPTRYYHAVSALLAGRAGEASALAERVMTADPQYAPIYDLAGAAYVKLGQAARARDAFLASLRFDARDSTAYTNLGLLELAAGNHEAAEGYFAEALWLVPESPVARDGLARAQAARRRP